MTDRKKVVAFASLGAAAALILAGCSAVDSSDDVAYCVDNNNRVVDQQKCDDDATSGGGAFWYLVGPYRSGITPGTRIDPDQATYSKFRSNDTTARSNAGLPETGKVSTGKSIGKSGGFGTGSGKSGGFGGGSGSHGFGG